MNLKLNKISDSNQGEEVIGEKFSSKTSSSNSKQYTVEIQIVIQKIGQINTKNETFYAEFFLEASWTERVFDQLGSKHFIYDAKMHFNPNIILNNSIGEPQQEISYNTKVLEGGKNSMSKLVKIIERRKVQGSFWQKFDFKYFPVDVQTLNIEISTSNPLQIVQLVESKEKFNFLNPKAFMDTQEWNLYNFVSSKESICKSEYSMDQYSSFTVFITASRIPSYYFYNAFLLVFLITTIGLTRFTVACDIPHVRLIIDTSVALTLITFKWVITEDIPQISYLTSLDKYTLFSIIFISSQSIYDSIIGVLTTAKCSKPYGYYDLISFYVSGSLIILANLILSFWIIFFAIRNRSNMYKKSKTSNENNSKRLFDIYNKGLKFESNLGSEKVESDDNDEDVYDDKDSSKSSESSTYQTIQL